MTESPLKLDHGAAYERALAAALDYLLTRRGERVRASEIWAAIQRREPFRIVVAHPDGSEADRTADRATQLAEVRYLLTALHRRARPVDSAAPGGDAADTEYQVLR
jgi:hypothetical protein